MVRKKMEGDEEQRRRAAHDAEQAGQAPSARGETTGASKQRTHRPDRSTLTHEEKMAPIHRGKQGRRGERTARAAEPQPERSFTGRGQPEYSQVHERVFRALVEAERQHGGEAVYLDEIARLAGLLREETRTLLHDLVVVHRLVTTLRDTGAELGPRFETKPRL